MEDDLLDLFDNVEVEKLTFVTKSEILYVDIVSTHLIDIEYIKKAEESIRLFVFDNGDDDDDRKVKIRVRYELSEQYDIEYIMRVHGDSILKEMREDFPVEYTLVKNSDLKFDSSRITITMTEGMMAVQRKWHTPKPPHLA